MHSLSESEFSSQTNCILSPRKLSSSRYNWIEWQRWKRMGKNPIFTFSSSSKSSALSLSRSRKATHYRINIHCSWVPGLALDAFGVLMSKPLPRWGTSNQHRRTLRAHSFPCDACVCGFWCGFCLVWSGQQWRETMTMMRISTNQPTNNNKSSSYSNSLRFEKRGKKSKKRALWMEQRFSTFAELSQNVWIFSKIL